MLILTKMKFYLERFYIYRLIIDLIQKSGKNLLGLFSRYSFSFQFRKDEETNADSYKVDLSFCGKKSITGVLNKMKIQVPWQ